METLKKYWVALVAIISGILYLFIRKEHKDKVEAESKLEQAETLIKDERLKVEQEHKETEIAALKDEAAKLDQSKPTEAAKLTPSEIENYWNKK